LTKPRIVCTPSRPSWSPRWRELEIRIVAALGGNALLQRGESPAAEIQEHHVVDAVEHLARIAGGNELIVTHGNGPQVGLLAIESANDPVLEHPYPFDVLGAQTQGMIGYWLVQALSNVLERPVVALVTRTIVDTNDSAFENPTKFVGRGYTEEEAQRVGAGRWALRHDGVLWRRVVPSPEPQRVVEIDTIKRLMDDGTVVVCAGGGGIPVARNSSGHLEGVEAVIDKDLAAALIARDVGADSLLLLTDVASVMRDFATANQRPISRATVEELHALSFPAGSMGPKVEAACRFVKASGKSAAIGTFDDAPGLLAGTAGTTVIP
jgi:carbamate kinase